MKYLQTFKIFERKGNYQLFHKTGESDLIKILKGGYIIAGGDDKDNVGSTAWDSELRRNVIRNWEKGKFPTISATRNLDFMGLPALELDVEKISDNYKILPYIENLDYYLDYKGEPTKNKNISNFQNLIRSKSKNAGKAYWKVKTNKGFDFGISEELIIAKKLDVSKYVKRIILNVNSFYYSGNSNDKIKKLVKEKYPHIEIIELDNHKGYSNIKQILKQKEKKPVTASTY